jgi:uncharacterized protein (DUF433 family)
MAKQIIKEQRDHNARSAKLVIHDDPMPIRIDSGGAVRVGPTRVTLETVMSYFNSGYTPEKIQDSFPTLRLADIYSVIGYYLRHKDEVEEYLRQSEQEAAEIRKEIETYQNSDEFRARQEAGRAAQTK